MSYVAIVTTCPRHQES